LLVDFGGEFGFGAESTIRQTTLLGPSPDDPVRYWNNMTQYANGSQLLNLVMTDNTPTSINLVGTSGFSQGLNTGTRASSLYPANATYDNFFLQGAAPTASFVLNGLDVNGTYDFTFYGSRINVSNNRETRYTASGLNTGFADLQVANNVDNTVSVLGIVPNATGEITISIERTVNNNSGFGYLTLMEMTVVPEPTTAMLLVAGSALLLLFRRRNSA